jgi:hypothetical protein
MLEIAERRADRLTGVERDALLRVMAEAFTLTVPAGQIADYYCAHVDRVLLAYSDGALAGFQFFQECRVDDVDVSHFSLAGKSEAYAGKGLQRAFGAWLIRRAIGHIGNPFRKIAIAGVSNNPKSYRNMLLVGGSAFPDVTRPGRPFRHADLYARVAQRLGLTGLDVSTGVIRDRCASLGLRLKETSFERRADAINRGFMSYIDHDVNHGVFTMVVSTPFNAIASFAGRQLGLGARS